MLTKTIFIISLAFIFSINYDEIILANEEKRIFTKAPYFTKRTYLIDKYDLPYCEIINFYGSTTIMKGENTIAVLKSGEESSFSFKFDNSNYFLIFELPSSFQICGFTIDGSSLKYTNILGSSMFLTFLKKRNFSLEIINDNKTIPKLIFIELYIFSPEKLDYLSFEENGKIISYEIEKNYYKVILKDKLKLNIILSTSKILSRDTTTSSVLVKKIEKNYDTEKEKEKDYKRMVLLSSSCAFICFFIFAIGMCLMCEAREKNPHYHDEFCEDFYNKIGFIFCCKRKISE